MARVALTGGGEGRPRIGDLDGHGTFGVLDEDGDGLLCHECGWHGQHLGLHAYKAHQSSARQYKIDHGLHRSKGLIAAAVRKKLAEHGAAELPKKATFLAGRDPRKATAARLASGMSLSPAGAAASAGAGQTRRGQRRAGIVVTCQECGVEFCPLLGPTGEGSAHDPVPAGSAGDTQQNSPAVHRRHLSAADPAPWSRGRRGTSS